VGVLGVMVMPYHLEHWWGRVGAVAPAISVSFVTAIEDQSSSFDWRSFLLPVARQLELPDKDM
jgi:hypothetical protein